MTPSILKVTPTHLYTDKTKFVIQCNVTYEATATEADKLIKHRVLLDDVEITPYQADYTLYDTFTIELPVEFLTNNKIIKINIKNQSEIDTLLYQIKREDLYRITAERTFTKIDGGYKEARIDKSNNKMDLITSTSEVLTNTKEIPINIATSKLTLS